MLLGDPGTWYHSMEGGERCTIISEVALRREGNLTGLATEGAVVLDIRPDAEQVLRQDLDEVGADAAAIPLARCDGLGCAKSGPNSGGQEFWPESTKFGPPRAQSRWFLLPPLSPK